MRRSVLITLAVLGALLSVVSGAGLFAALSDTAHSGTNEISTGSLPASADLQLASATGGAGVQCGTFADDLQTPLITVTGETPGWDSGIGYYYCLRNLGSQTVNVTALPQSFTDVDTACTGDEAEYDITCGSNQQGELGDIVKVNYFSVDCATGGNDANPPSAQVNLRDTVQPFGTLAPNQTRCFISQILMSHATQPQRQAAQTDKITWVWAFTGTV